MEFDTVSVSASSSESKIDVPILIGKIESLACLLRRISVLEILRCPKYKQRCKTEIKRLRGISEAPKEKCQGHSKGIWQCCLVSSGYLHFPHPNHLSQSHLPNYNIKRNISHLTILLKALKTVDLSSSPSQSQL